MSSSEKPVRTRFAPSPTGFLHVGGIRTALFGWLVAHQAGGQFILRLEDTDKAREVAGADEHIIKSLRALGLDYDEGPDKGGPYAPYRQSQRLDSYKAWAQKLIDAGRAYGDPLSPAEVQALRDRARAAKKPFLYRDYRPANPPAWDGARPLRFKSEPKAYKWHDEVMGDLSTGPEVIDDFILIKSDGYPTYNFAHIVDDAEMKISHVIRGQEFLASVPNYLNLYEALGLERPRLATMPHILGPDGNKKLSKRDGAKDVLDYIRDGYLPDALVNFIASLGWNDGSEQEIFSREELIKKFSLSHVQKSGARFDERRLEWMNGHYIRQMGVEQLSDLLNKSPNDYWGKGKSAEPTYKKAVLAQVIDRLKYLSELPQLTGFFFTKPSNQSVRQLYEAPEDRLLKDMPKGQMGSLLKAASQKLHTSQFDPDNLQACLNSLLEELETKPGVLFPIIRIALSGAQSTPSLPGVLSVLGKSESLARMASAEKILES
ncbi:MAG TPA: glutamate--tRNA ligase [Candidatus Saccharimonadales bacterium]|nr:glutamate--tRNA ligase [Candidatus Saccharimonadales bacterium]